MTVDMTPYPPAAATATATAAAVTAASITSPAAAVSPGAVAPSSSSHLEASSLAAKSSAGKEPPPAFSRTPDEKHAPMMSTEGTAPKMLSITSDIQPSTALNRAKVAVEGADFMAPSDNVAMTSTYVVGNSTEVDNAMRLIGAGPAPNDLGVKERVIGDDTGSAPSRDAATARDAVTTGSPRPAALDVNEDQLRRIQQQQLLEAQTYEIAQLEKGQKSIGEKS